MNKGEQKAEEICNICEKDIEIETAKALIKKIEEKAEFDWLERVTIDGDIIKDNDGNIEKTLISIEIDGDDWEQIKKDCMK